jgi:hypothetical protein
MQRGTREQEIARRFLRVSTLNFELSTYLSRIVIDPLQRHAASVVVMLE